MSDIDRQIDQQKKEKIMKDTFLATMSHELRTPLNGIMGIIAMLPDAGPLNKKQNEYVKILTECSLHLANLLNNILDFSKMTSDRLVLQKNSFDVKKTIMEAVKMIEGKVYAKNLTLKHTIPSDLPLMIGDSQRIIQILSNILGNAVKFTEIGGIELIVSATRINNNANHVGKWEITFHISDTGIGIPPTEKDKIFEVFQQSSSLDTYLSQLGTGLGLSIVRELTRLMGGTISVESEGIPGKGSTFTFHIIVDEDVNIDKLSSIHHKILVNSNILVVDDRQEMRLQVCNILFKWKCRPTAVSSAEEALQYLKNDVQFDVAIIDICMPYMSGVQLAQQLRKTHSKLPLIALASVKVEGGEKYFDYYMNKPVDPNQLLPALINCLTNDYNKMNSDTLKSSRDRKRKYREKLNILLAEDDPRNTFTMKEMLINLGYSENRIKIVENGKECIIEAERKKYDVILMDILMPILSGLEATKHIRQFSNPPMIIAVSAAVQDSDKNNCQEVGIDGYLSKPIINKNDLDAALSPLIKEHKRNSNTGCTGCTTSTTSTTSTTNKSKKSEKHKKKCNRLSETITLQ